VSAAAETHERDRIEQAVRQDGADINPNLGCLVYGGWMVEKNGRNLSRTRSFHLDP
jgi:hypothetical protein